MPTVIADNLHKIHEMLQGTGARLVAVSKFHPVDAIKEAYNAGQRLFGESRVQELIDKAPRLPDDIRWHFIGHLQTNKVKALLPHVSMIESVDSIKLLELIDREAQKASLCVNILMQVHVAAEETKTGFLPEELLNYFKNRGFESLKATHICGVMGMASNTDDKERIKSDFRNIAGIYNNIKQICPDLRGFDTLSMGMSGDWTLAVKEGSNLVRIGTAIFGAREY